ncbi:MAG: hypothetical protein LBQ89_09615, partial [Treponema sp.]|nr:hypothetical protein [Treponema sp.]
DIANIGILMLSYERRPNNNPEEIIVLGEYIIQNINIDQLMYAENYGASEVKNNLRVVLRVLRRAYEATNNHIEYEKIQGILNKYW